MITELKQKMMDDAPSHKGFLRVKKGKIDCLSLWLVNKTAHIDVVDVGGGKIYSYSYPYVYAVSFNGKVTVNNNSPRSVRSEAHAMAQHQDKG